MNKQMQLPRFWKLALIQLALSVGIVAAWFYFRTSALLAVPPPPVGDLYAYNWGFQLAVFVVIWLPATLLIAGILLAIEYEALKPRYSAQQSQDGGHAA
jgi:hypothetical protein